MRKLLQNLYVPLLLVLVGALAYVPAALLGGQVDRLESRVTDGDSRISQVDKDLAVLAVKVPEQLARMDDKLCAMQRDLDLLVREIHSGESPHVSGGELSASDGPNGGR